MGRKDRIPDGAADKVTGLFKKFTPGLKKADAPTGRTDLPENPRVRSSGSGDVGNPTPRDVDAYNKIRGNPHDTPRIAANVKVPQDVVDRAKRNLFLDTHKVQTGPNTTEVGRFTPDKRIADLWEKAENGTLTDKEQKAFKKLLAHEYVESKLMERGLPYRSDHPDYWNHPDFGPGTATPSPAHHGAHDLAPNESPLGEWSHYWRMDRDDPGIDIADDLSNLDDVVDKIWQGRK